MKEMVGGCCVCSDERGWPDNPLVYCDGNGCTVAVHQACYGIVTVPTGPWYCRKCEGPPEENKGKVRCELCPSKSGALKRTDTDGWAHVVCALYIPEVRFGNVTSMEPIVLRLIPAERYNKTCYICHDSGKINRSTAGACMPCNKSGCKQQFHVTCAQSLGLLCEEAGNYLDNVKYCGYCQYHYGRLKKGGNVKTIPPYKPVYHDSSDSSPEREPSPRAGSATPNAKSKGPGRKSSTAAAGKSTPNSKSHNAAPQPMGSKQHPDKKKPSPNRRGSSAGDGASGSGSKNSTPAPSPQHPPPEAPQPPPAKGPGGSTPKGTPPSASPKPEPAGVAPSAAAGPPPPVPSPSVSTANVAVTSTVVHTQPAKPVYQESVITNAENMETKQTKKRKAVAAANAAASAAAAAPVDYAAPAQPVPEIQPPTTVWEGAHPADPTHIEPVDKVIKKAKTDVSDNAPLAAHFSSLSPAPPPPPPPPAHSPASQPSPRHLPSPMPGPSGMSTVTNIRSPQPPPPQIPTAQDMSAHSPHIFHHPQKQAAMDSGMAGHGAHSGRSAWGGLNVAYEMQDPNKPGMSGVPGPSKDMNLAGIPMPPTTIRTKKRQAMANTVVSMGTPPPPAPIQTVTSQSLANARRPPQPTPPPIYQETIKDSPPSSPSSGLPLRPPKMEQRLGVTCTAPHMLGNELNPESGAAQRLQEQLSAELAAHAAGAAGHDPLVPPPLINKAAPSTSSGRGGSAQSLDQLLERQWEQGSQFLMEQAQHFDIASLLSCLHQLRTENVRLEDHVGSLLQRRDHLLAVNARLAIPLSAVSTGPPEPPRCSREGSQVRAPPPPPRAPETITSAQPHQFLPPQMMMREVQQKPS